jgi:type IX secretion system substrate protein
MKKKYLLLSFVIVCVLGIMSTTNVNSHIAFAPPGYCGDPTDYYSTPPTPYATCTFSGCHGGAPQAVNSSNLSLTIGADTTSLATFDNTFRYTPGQTYYIRLSVLAPGYVWGFQMTSLNPGLSMAGTYAVTSPSTTHLIPAVSPMPGYITHLHANHNVNSWLYKWTAPTTDSAVTFYYAFNAGDSLDFTNLVADHNIFADTVIVLAAGTGVENISSQISGLQVYPNPVDGAFNLSFDVLKAGQASALLYSVDGKLCRQLFNENLGGGTFNRNYNIASLASGVYLVKLNIGGATVTQKIVKE